jgi:hypothetical protein
MTPLSDRLLVLDHRPQALSLLLEVRLALKHLTLIWEQELRFLLLLPQDVAHTSIAV